MGKQFGRLCVAIQMAVNGLVYHENKQAQTTIVETLFIDNRLINKALNRCLPFPTSLVYIMT